MSSSKAFLLFLTFLSSLFISASAQRYIQYESGMGSRDRDNPDVWILYNKVKASHEGMLLFTDSASYDTKNNTFIAHRNVRIVFSDTTVLTGDAAIYDGTTRIADVWGKTVSLVDGKTVLTTVSMSYDRNISTAAYYNWGHTVNDSTTLDSRIGMYNTSTRDLFLFDSVILRDSSSKLITDTLLYNTRTSIASFVSPTYIYNDSSTLYSENGYYNSDSHEAASFKASRLTDRATKLTADTLFFNDLTEYGTAFGNVVISDTVNELFCYGMTGVTNQKDFYSFVTDSALIVYTGEEDTLYLHADTLWAYNDSVGTLLLARAYHNVRAFRADAQAICDSAIFSAQDSLAILYNSPVVWYGDYQCSADTIFCFFDTVGVKRVELHDNVFAIEKVDAQRFSQIKGNNSVVYCSDNEPLYADIIGSAQMIYYVLDQSDTTKKELIGVNCGIGSDIRIYFNNRSPRRVVTFGKPEMKMYNPSMLPDDQKFLQGFSWLEKLRPRSPLDLFSTSTSSGNDNVTK